MNPKRNESIEELMQNVLCRVTIYEEDLKDSCMKFMQTWIHAMQLKTKSSYFYMK